MYTEEKENRGIPPSLKQDRKVSLPSSKSSRKTSADVLELQGKRGMGACPECGSSTIVDIANVIRNCNEEFNLKSTG